MIFNSSESYEVLPGNGVRLNTFTVEPGQTAHLHLTHHPKHAPHFTIHRIAGKVCGAACPDKEGVEVTKQTHAVSPNNPYITITVPGTYYPHSLEAAWMDDPCNPVILEVDVA